MDVAFIVRSLKMTVVLSILGYMLGTVYANHSWGVGFLLGALWSAANLYLIKALIERVITPDTRPLSSIVLHAVFKFPLLYAGGYFILSSTYYDPWAPTLGFTLPFLVIFLKAGGRMLLGLEGAGHGRSSSRVEAKLR